MSLEISKNLGEYLDIAKGRGEFKVYYEKIGEDSAPEKVVLINGFLTPCTEWGRQIEHFKSHPEYQICIYDNRGIGKSGQPTGGYSTQHMAKDIVELMDHLQWKSFHVVGLSMGGMIAIELASLATDRINSLALCVTHPGSMPPTRGMLTISQSIFTPDHRKRGELMLPILYSPGYLAKMNLEEPTRTNKEVLLDRFVEKALNGTPPGIYGVMGHIKTVLTHSVSKKRLLKLKDAGFPITIVTGTDDHLVKPSNSHYLNEILKPAEFSVFEGAGHVVNIECIDKFNDLIIRNLRRGSKSSPLTTN